MRTALVRDRNNNLKIVRDDYYTTQSEMAEELRANGFKVLKIWNGNKTDAEVNEWEFFNRK